MNKKHISIAFVILVIGVFFYCITKIQYHPKELTAKSKQFIQLLYKNDLESAYELTTKKGSYYDFSSLQLFKKAVERQSIGFNNAKNIKIEYQSNSPYQTYGNRLRRWFSGKELNEQQKNLDFHINVNGKKDIHSFIGFEVRWEFQADKSWKVIFFQSHAY